jgi:photosystem II stability/assembly factor-like uncharacterized protein
LTPETGSPPNVGPAFTNIRTESEPKVLPTHFRSVSFVDERRGWGISSDSLWKSEDGGVSWSKVFTFEGKYVGHARLNPNLISIQTFSDGRILILSTLDGLIEFQSNDASTKVIFPAERALARAFYFLNKDFGWLVGQSLTKKGGQWDAMAFKTDDGGNTWHSIRLERLVDCQCAFYDVLALDQSSVVFVGDVIARTTDGGQSVEIVEGSADLERKGLGRLILGQSSGAGILSVTSHSGKAYMVSFDGGSTWKRREIAGEWGLDSVLYLNRKEALALSGNTIFYSADTGLTWRKKLDVTGTVPHRFYRMPGTEIVYVVGSVFLPIDSDLY